MVTTDRDWLREETRARTSLIDLIGRDVALRRRGRHYVGLCPFHRERTPSFIVTEGKGLATCFGCGWSGDVFRYHADRTGLGFAAALDDLAIRAGLLPDRAGRQRPVARPVTERRSGDDEARELSARIAGAWQIWTAACSWRHPAVDAYLAGRGIQFGSWPPTLRYHPRAPHRLARVTAPAMVAAIQAGDGRVRGVHCTFLAPGGVGKATGLGKTKLMYGQAWGGAIRLTQAAAHLHVAEGIETAASILVAGAGAHVWAAGSLGNMAAMELPRLVRMVHLWTDGDSDPAAMDRMVAAAVARYGGEGRQVLVHPAPAGQDWNDVLQGAAG